MVVVDFNLLILEEGELCEIIGSLGIIKMKLIDWYWLLILRKIIDKSYKIVSSLYFYYLLGKIWIGFICIVWVLCF